MMKSITLDLYDMLETCGFDWTGLEYILLVEMKSNGFPIDFDYKNPKNLKPHLKYGKIKTITYQNSNRLDYIHYD
ncbi:hypothetical protein ZPAH1_orf00220 [Aeromonas phage ZPAH1]|nr:hypothetical protein ASwh1_171 [Aeromonas phage Aswh_1]QQG33982.1 hypothetical protein ZPAH1_orf00220 [Aeromonas phage ZPAH1]